MAQLKKMVFLKTFSRISSMKRLRLEEEEMDRRWRKEAADEVRCGKVRKKKKWEEEERGWRGQWKRSRTKQSKARPAQISKWQIVS